jgi:hypothetical protein
MTMTPPVRVLSILMSSLTLWAALPVRADAQPCQPGIDAAWEAHRPSYDLLWTTLVPNIGTLTTQLVNTFDSSTYAALLASARSIASAIPTGRIVLTLADGTVVVDTSRPDGETPSNANSYAHFLAKSIDENQNTRVAMMSAQMFPCGVAIETNAGTSGFVESQFAVRLGAHLTSNGTARLSVILAGPWDY